MLGDQTCLFASSREAKRRRGPEPRADHWCRIGPEWRTAPLRRGGQKSIKSTRYRIHMVAAYDVSFFYAPAHAKSRSIL